MLSFKHITATVCSVSCTALLGCESGSSLINSNSSSTSVCSINKDVIEKAENEQKELVRQLTALDQKLKGILTSLKSKVVKAKMSDRKKETLYLLTEWFDRFLIQNKSIDDALKQIALDQIARIEAQGNKITQTQEKEISIEIERKTLTIVMSVILQQLDMDNIDNLQEEDNYFALKKMLKNALTQLIEKGEDKELNDIANRVKIKFADWKADSQDIDHIVGWMIKAQPIWKASALWFKEASKIAAASSIQNFIDSSQAINRFCDYNQDFYEKIKNNNTLGAGWLYQECKDIESVHTTILSDVSAITTIRLTRVRD